MLNNIYYDNEKQVCLKGKPEELTDRYTTFYRSKIDDYDRDIYQEWWLVETSSGDLKSLTIALSWMSIYKFGEAPLKRKFAFERNKCTPVKLRFIIAPAKRFDEMVKTIA